MTGAGQDTVPEVTEDKAKGLAEQYTQQYLPGFTVERVLPFTGMHRTMYQAELKGNRIWHASRRSPANYWMSWAIRARSLNWAKKACNMPLISAKPSKADHYRDNGS